MGSQVVKRSIRNQRVVEKTGRGWDQWFELLDGLGAANLSHKQIARLLDSEYELGGWWSQTVTVEYERARGRRQPGQKPAGFELSVQRTINAPVTRAWNAWAEAEQLSSWFTTGQQQEFREGARYRNNDGDAGTFLRIVPRKQLRFTWETRHHRPGSEVRVEFAAKGRGRSVVRLTHSKLGSKQDRDDLKPAWGWAMDSLKSWLETGKPLAS
jgi:uncharacterized protein YndB with AHSA1/START domain